MMRLFLIATLLLPALGSFAAAPAWGQSAIRVLVNDQPITSYDIQQRTRMLRAFTRGKEGEKQAIEQLIDEHLMLQEATRRRAAVSDDQVEAEFATRARSAKMSPAQFRQAMRQAGFDPQTFEDFLRANMSWRQVVRSRFRATVKVTDQDVTAALTGRENTEADLKTVTEYLLQQIIFILPKGASAGAKAQKRREAAAFAKAFQGCDHTLEQIGGTPGIVMKPNVRRDEGKLSPDLKKALAALDVGGVTQPEPVAEGIQLVAVCAKNEIPGQTEAEVKAREEISSKRGELLARRYLRDLRSDAVIEYR